MEVGSRRLRAALRWPGRVVVRAGFTILEILIAIVVLALGITGIVALFPTAIESGNRTVEDSYAAAVTQSVVDAITVGIRESRYSYTSSTSGTWTYFIFNHDGVVDAPPKTPNLYTAAQDNPNPAVTYPNGPLSPGTGIFNKDYCILLPKAVNLGATSPDGRGGGIAGPPHIQAENEPIFVYPPPLVPAQDAQARSAASLDAGTVVDDLNVNRWVETTDGTRVPWVPRVYQLGRYRDPGPGGPALPTNPPMDPGDVRLEFRGDDVKIGSTDVETIAIDPYPTYSFAFTIQRARIDTTGDGRIDNNDQFSDSLYQIRVMVFKGFDQAAADRLAFPAPAGEPCPRTNVPIREFVTLISI